MSASIEPQGKGKRTVTATLNLVPYIDLLTCMVAFLLITAVWTQLAQLKVSQRGNGEGTEDSKPMVKIAVVVDDDTINVVVDQDRQVLPDKNGQPDRDALAALLTKAKGHYPDKDDLQIASADAVLFDRLTGIMDIAIAAGFPGISLVPGGEAGL